MRVFISWSGDRSKAVATALRDWLPQVIQCIKPFMSDKDIAAGTRWRTVLSKNLQDCKYGIICVTADNLNAPWLLFEAGAIAKAVDEAFVCPLLLDLNPNDLGKSPLSEFQSKRVDKMSMFEVLSALNDAAGNFVSSAVLSKSFEAFWQELNDRIKAIPDLSEAANQKEEKSDEITLKEVFYQIQNLGKLITRESDSQANPDNISATILTEGDVPFSKDDIPPYAEKYGKLISGLENPKAVCNLLLMNNLMAKRQLGLIFTSELVDYIIRSAVKCGKRKDQLIGIEDYISCAVRFLDGYTQKSRRWIEHYLSQRYSKSGFAT